MTGKRPVTALGNLGRKALRRLMSAHKPLVRHARRRARADQQAGMVERVRAIDQEIAAIVRSRGPIIAGPWLAEVGYEVLYWIPFLRWLQDRHQVGRDRLVALSRGGLEHLYEDVASRYVDIFDDLSPSELAARNEARQQTQEAGGRKQTVTGGTLDTDLLRTARARTVSPDAAVLHPSLMFRLFREAWYGNLPIDVLWTHTDYAALRRPPRPQFHGLPGSYVAVKFYSGVALRPTEATRAALHALVASVACHTPVVVLDAGLGIDDHTDFAFTDIPNVVSARGWMTPRNNLGVQAALIAHADYFLGTCGGLAWVAPFMGVPTVAVYEDDSFLSPHLLIARQAGQRTGAAEFTTLDLRALSRFTLWQRD
jgi:hypothetical protein